jgi:hypothetical protein
MILAALLATAAPAAAEVPADLPPAQGVDIGPASYKCYYLTGTAADYSFVDVIIIDAGTYADGAGHRGRYHRAGRDIVFNDGPLTGRPAYAERGRVYLALPGSSFYMSCSPG